MQITVSSDRKMYRRDSSGNLDTSVGAFHSQTITLPDDSTSSEIMSERFRLMEDMDFMVDTQLFVNGVITGDQLTNRKKNRHEKYHSLMESLEIANTK